MPDTYPCQPLPGAVEEGVDRLDRHSTEPALLAPLQPAGDLLRRPSFQQALAHEAAEPFVALQDRGPLPPLAVAALGVHRQVAALGQRVAPQLAADRRGRPTERPRDSPQAQPLGPQGRQPFPFRQLQMRPVRHGAIPDCRSRPGRYHTAPGCCTSRRTPPVGLAERQPTTQQVDISAANDVLVPSTCEEYRIKRLVEGTKPPLDDAE